MALIPTVLVVHHRDLLRDSGRESASLRKTFLLLLQPTTRTNGHQVVMLNHWNESQSILMIKIRHEFHVKEVNYKARYFSLPRPRLDLNALTMTTPDIIFYTSKVRAILSIYSMQSLILWVPKTCPWSHRVDQAFPCKYMLS